MKSTNTPQSQFITKLAADLLMRPNSSYKEVINKLAVTRGYGIARYDMHEIADSTIASEREYVNLLSLNINGLNKKFSNGDLADLYAFIHKHSISGIGLQEHNLVYKQETRLKKSIKHAIEGYEHCRVTISQGLPGEKRTAVGGSAMILGGVLAKYTAMSHITDPRGWGRFCGRKIVGPNNHKLAISLAFAG